MANTIPIAERRQRLVSYLKQHFPYATTETVKKAHRGNDLLIVYGNSMKKAWADVEIEPDNLAEMGRRIMEREWLALEMNRKRIADLFKKNHNAMSQDIKRTGLRRDFGNVYDGIKDARRDLGVILDGYISAAEAARRLGITREWVSRLVERDELPGYYVGRWLVVSSSRMEKVGRRLTYRNR